jgi:eukaryotic-like serine/threonine-protein kinase
VLNEESLFEAALEKPTASERRAFLESACAGDSRLRKRVELLLAAHDNTRGILDASAGSGGWTKVGAGLTPDGGSQASELVGTTIADRYRLLEEIGGGGMGTVWKAEQKQPVRRTVALKLIRPGMDSRSVLSRFEVERQALALMDHQNIARVLDGGTTDSGRPFFVMEYVKGVPLTKYCDDARLSITQRLALFVPACQAVQHAHTKGVIHRDLKPSNILVCLQDGQPMPKVIDFGLAKAMHQPLTDHTLHTAHGMLVGTPLYMSPEQAEPNNLDVDARTDVYALGVILYELLTGTTPVERGRFHEAAWHEMLRLIKEEEPPRPSARLSGSDSLPSLAAQRQVEPVRLTWLLRGELDWIVMKALQKDRSRRYETANSFARDIERYLHDEPVDAGPPSAIYRLQKFGRRHRVALALAAAFAAVLMGATAVSTWQAVRARRAQAAAVRAYDSETLQRRVALEQRDRAVQAEAQAKRSETEARSVLGFFRERVLSAPRPEGQEGGLGREVTLRAALDAAEPGIATGFAEVPTVEAAIRDALGESYSYLGETALAIRQLERARTLRTAELGRDHVDTLESMNKLAVNYWQAGRIDDSVALHEETLRLRRAKLGADDPATIGTMNDLALAYQDAGRLSEAITLLEQARKPFEEKMGLEHPDTLTCMSNLAVAYRHAGRLGDALPLYEETHRRLLAKLGREHPTTLYSMHNLASGYDAAGKRDLSLPLFAETLKLRKAKLGADHPDTLNTMNSLASTYQNDGKLNLALPLYEETLKLRKAKLGADHPDTLNSTNNLAMGYRALGKFELALPLLEENHKLSRARLGAKHPFTLIAMNNLAKCYRTANKVDKAMPLFQEAAEGFEKLRFRHSHAGRTLSDLISAHEDLKHFHEAEVWRRKWLGALKEQDGADSLSYAIELSALGANLLEQEQWTSAEPVLREALAVLEKKQPGEWAMHNARSQLGGALLEQKKYSEAESLLIQAYTGLKAREEQIPQPDRHCVAKAGERIVRLYATWGRPDQAADWQNKLASPAKAESKR